MCGIFGVFSSSNSESIDSGLAKSSLLKMSHRGPDFQDIKLINENVILGHARLSIIDLNQNSNQPFRLNHLYLTFNGEIFNYLELREELVNLGYKFTTQSDTEVLIAAYDKWGPDCVNKFNGMWAFAIYDEIKNSLFCSRDRFGIKPFNYSFENGLFVFSSEIKSILHYAPYLRVPNYNSIANYCRESIGAQSEETWFQKVFRLKPATNLIIDHNGDLYESQYWSYPTQEIDSFSEKEALNSYKKLFEDSIKLRMRSDVAIGATLSSGLDSSSVVSYIDKNYNNTLNCYTASFPEFEGDEYPIAEKFASSLNVKLHQVISDYTNYTKILSDLIYHLESGHSSPAIFPLFFITKEAKKEITVFLEGQGADELLGGYVDKTFIVFILDKLVKLNFKDTIRELSAFSRIKSFRRSLILFLRNNGHPIIRKFMRWIYGSSNIYSGPLLKYKPFKFKKAKGFSSRLNRVLAEQHQTGLVNLLHYGDAISMMHSLENRLPFMDYRLVEYAFKLPVNLKIRSGVGKFIQREAVKEILPNYILNNPIKMGFPSPLKELFREKSDALQILMSDRFKERGIFNVNGIMQIIKIHKSGKKDYSRLLYRVLSVELWFRNFIDKKSF